MKFVNCADVSFEIWSLSNVTVRDPKYYFILLDLELPKVRAQDGNMLPQILPIPAAALAGDFIRPRQHIMQRSLVSSFPAVKQLVKLGDRIFGYGQVTCPDCVTERYYWVFSVYGNGGWYLEFNKDTSPPIEMFSMHTEDLIHGLDLEHRGIPIK